MLKKNNYNKDPEFLATLPSRVIQDFTSHNNNSVRVIAERYNVAESRVHKIINQYLADTMRK